MTKRECAIVMAFTGTCLLTGENLGEFYSYVREILGRPIFSHEYPIFAEEIKAKAKPDFLRLCKEASE